MCPTLFAVTRAQGLTQSCQHSRLQPPMLPGGNSGGGHHHGPSANMAQHFLQIVACFILLHVRNNCGKRANQISRQFFGSYLTNFPPPTLLLLILTLSLLLTEVCSLGPGFVHPLSLGELRS